MKNCTPLWRKAYLQAKKLKTPHVWSTFGSWDVEKVHGLVAQSTFANKKGKNTSRSEHFWQLGCRKSARRCGAKHISKSKCTKHHMFAPLLEVEMPKKCTPLWREAHFEVKMYKTPHVRATFGGWDAEKVHAVVARSTFPSQNVQNTRGFGPLFDVQMSFRVAGARDCAPCQKWAEREGLVAFSTATTTTPHYTPIHYTTLDYTKLHYTTTTLHYIPLHYTTLHYTPLHSTTLHYTTLHSTTLHYTNYIYIYIYNYNYNYNNTTFTLRYTTLH